MTCTVDVRGGATGTIHTEALQPDGLVSEVHALVLSGSSAFELRGRAGLMSALAADGRGFEDRGPVTPIVSSAAILFDLVNGGYKDWGPQPSCRELSLGRSRVVSVWPGPSTIGPT